MDRLDQIPTPAAQLWREFRVKVAPLFFFAAAVTTVAWIWRANISAPTLIGEVEAIKSNISSPKAGKLSQLTVNRLDHVKPGQVIAQVITTDPQILQSSLAVIQAEIQLLRVNLEPVLGQQRFALTYDRLRLDWMDQRVQLATARVRLELARADFHRAEELFKEKIVSQQALDSARSAQQALEAEVEERSRLVTEQEQKLHLLALNENGSSFPRDTNPEDVMQASIKVQEEKLRLTEAELSPIKLTVEVDGIVSAIHHRSGEAVVAGEPIVTLTASRSDRIVGYLREPLSFRPEVGMPVEVRARSLERCVSRAEILEVGEHMEPINSTLSGLGTARAREVGLPVLVSLPPSQKLLPGELVELRILSGKGYSRPLEISIVH